MQSKLEIIYGLEVANKIQEARVLVVGAGGIGCELVKIMSMSGFQHIQVVDLDTIDISNLNRQFLFRRKHVDQPKSQTLKQAICEQNPNIEIQAFVGRIQEDRFGFTFFSQFGLVINALDNPEARNHVNKMCFNLNIPLVEAGTNGYKATCNPIKKGVTQCFQCVPSQKEQTFPMCTIRQRPEKLIHCIQWAKYLYEGLFGPKDQASNNMIVDIIEELEVAKGTPQFSQIIFDRVFNDEPAAVVKAHGERITKGEEKIDADELKEMEEFLKKVQPLLFAQFTNSIKASTITQANLALDEKLSIQKFDVKDWVALFMGTIAKIQTEKKELIGSLMFDKDDYLAMDFVTAATNIRAYNFSIEMETLFKIKEMAGKIVPAISSSNALAAALQVTEAIKLLAGDRPEQLRGVSYKRIDDRGRLQPFNRSKESLNPDCPVCQDNSQHIAVVKVKSLTTFTLQECVDQILVNKLGFVKDGGIMITLGSGILAEIDEDLSDDEAEIMEKKLSRSLDQLKVQSLAILEVLGKLNQDEEDQNMSIQIVQDQNLSEPWSCQVLKVGTPNKKPTPQPEAANEGQLDLSDDEVEIAQPAPTPPNLLTKRVTDNSADISSIEKKSHEAKRQKITE